jgi:hypothetical protein
MPRAEKGQRFGGRQKGTPNKLPRGLVERLVEIDNDLEAKGLGLGVQAEKDPKWYFENFAKPRIPKNVTLEGSLGLEIEIFIGPKKVT